MCFKVLFCWVFFFFLLSPNPEMCVSALRWSGFGWQLYRNRVSRCTRTLLRRRARLYSQLRQEVRTAIYTSSLHAFPFGFFFFPPSFRSIYTFSAGVSSLLQEELDVEVLRQENPLLPAPTEHPEEPEGLPGAASGTTVRPGRSESGHCSVLISARLSKKKKKR